jgi:hypothetical protein
MTVFEELQQASFRDVPFLFRDESKDGGKKIVTHEYPFANRRFTEELGELPPTFRMQAIIYGSIQDRLNFERVLTLPGLGKLVHPVYGDIQVKATTYSVNSSQATVGEFRFSVNFEASEANITAEPTSTTKENVSERAALARLSLYQAMQGMYVEPRSSFEAQKSRNKLIDATETLMDLIDTIATPDAEAKAIFNQQINTTLASAGNYVQTAAQVTSGISDCFDAALAVVETPDILLEQWTQALGFGYLINPSQYFGTFGRDSGLNVGKINTVKRKNAETNRQIFNEYFRAQALINLYEAAAYKDFRTDVELNETMDALSTAYRLQFQDGYEVDPAITLISNDQDMRDKLLILRSNAVSTYNEKLQNAWHIVDIDPGISSMPLTTYRYYGDLGNLELLSELNKEDKVSYVSHGIKAVAT